MAICLECGVSIVSGDLCKFHKCFRKDSLLNYAVNKAALKGVSMNASLVAKRLQFQEIVIKEGGYSYEEVAEMSMVELRDAVDQLRPLVIVNSSATLTGGKTKKVTVVRKIA